MAAPTGVASPSAARILCARSSKLAMTLPSRSRSASYVVGLRDLDRALAHEAMAAGRAPARLVEHLAGDNAIAVQHHQAAHRADELPVAIAPPHHLRDRQLLQRCFDEPGKARVEPRAGHGRAEGEDFLLAVVDPLELVHRYTLLLREAGEGGARRAVGDQARLHRRSFREHLAIRCLRRDIPREHAQASRRRVDGECAVCRREPLRA